MAEEPSRVISGAQNGLWSLEVANDGAPAISRPSLVPHDDFEELKAAALRSVPEKKKHRVVTIPTASQAVTIPLLALRQPPITSPPLTLSLLQNNRARVCTWWM